MASRTCNLEKVFREKHNLWHSFMGLHFTPFRLHSKKFWAELITYFPAIGHKQHRKWRVQQFFYCYIIIIIMVMLLPSLLPSNNRCIHRHKN
jgi:hypothetical protein